jgi:hypothetical protein
MVNEVVMPIDLTKPISWQDPAGMQKWPMVWGQAAGGPLVSFDFSGLTFLRGLQCQRPTRV